MSSAATSGLPAPAGSGPLRTILHCDLNNFYASVECLYRPELRDRPVAVCGQKEKRHGIVLAKNMPAKRCGIRTGEAVWQARAKCPDLVIVPPDFPRYLEFSRMVREIYAEYTDRIEPYGIDECWLDLSDRADLRRNAPAFADRLRERVREELGVTLSIGVSWNKVFAKLGSDMKKPDATTVIRPEDFRETVWPLPVDELLFVGRSTGARLRNIGVGTIGRLARLQPDFIRGFLGKWGEYLWMFANGFDASPVERAGAEVPVKGVGNSMTTPRDVVGEEDARMVFRILSESVAERLRRHGFRGRTVQVWLRDVRLASFERQRKLPRCTCLSGEILAAALALYRENWDPALPLRSVGVRVTDLVPADTPVQLDLFDVEVGREREERLERTLDSIRSRFGPDAVQRALLLSDRAFHAHPAEEHVIFPGSRCGAS